MKSNREIDAEENQGLFPHERLIGYKWHKHVWLITIELVEWFLKHHKIVVMQSLFIFSLTF